MKTVGQILQATRNAQKLDLKDVSRITRIRDRFLEAVEADDYSQLPSGAVARGFIRNYSEFLGLKPESILAVFRRDFVENEAGQVVPRGLAQPVSEVSLWTPRTTIIAIITFIFTLFGAYLIYQYRVLTGPPPLRLVAPADKLETTDTTIEIVGITSPEATISINGDLVVLEKGGRFFLRLPLTDGENTISIIATSKSGKTASQIRTIIKK
ncbi:MAG: Transcriptional regulator, XRE family [Candidatus Amesbacteria bacterium GW2011_GWA2_47_11b]|uniref:Transcriptional regulator, XRE family n=3 Tax=Candidatus Amesiibacteriota TaxID=1752730 RepID=A0A0G1SKU4_9BACT|nr:MAG: hypothetical protein UX42_C0002G0032 [Microgenomates group bacterium GW2011_GWC1_46_20]KKU57920.1 MAG: Transcriptional regulator, XRE family [Candidatus Amesbacteria bacterium GW2011_GWA2_47_11b]KKU70041.1 MAG: Transcriptional regulator, XRE family [Candidatus Amesbacteria bacterium GW2011_GWA1_47_20]KKU83972.1 MAG: Transcriptional regulator, XRE family [Candidatus Amesbacteria bacterium GW2011_GWC2_47_8]